MFSYLIQCNGVRPANDWEDQTGQTFPSLISINIHELQQVEAEYCIANGHTHDAHVIYGDTDSVMVKFGPTDLAKVMALGA